MLDAYIYDGIRSPIGRHAGKLAPMRPDDLAGEVIAEVVKRNGIKPEDISDVVLGCVTQAGEDCRNVARFAALMAGLPPTTPGVTVNRLCASGLQAVTDAARAISCGEGEMYIAGGVESMSRAPYVFAKSETPFGRDVKLYDSTIGSRFTNPKFRKLFGDHQMPETGDNVAREFGVTREQADEFALASQKKYAKAEAEGFYKGEIMAIALPQKKKDAPPVTVEADEHPRRDSTLESLAKLKPLYEGGVVTAGNASGVNDGAAALIIASRKWGEKNGKKPIARIVSAASAAVEPPSAYRILPTWQRVRAFTDAPGLRDTRKIPAGQCRRCRHRRELPDAGKGRSGSGIDFGLTVAAELAGDEVAKSIQLVLEYDPQPPFDSGSPEKAGVERVKRIRERLAPLLESRRKANAEAAARLS
jgi:acetyl-CoA C-acetyltransferase